MTRMKRSKRKSKETTIFGLLLGDSSSAAPKKKVGKHNTPWWVSLYGTALIVAGVGWATQTPQDGYTFFFNNALFVIPLIIVVSVASFQFWQFRNVWFRKRWAGGIEMQTLDALNGYAFEEACAEIFRRDGYRVEVTQRSRDQGADLILTGKGERIVVQAKRQVSNVGNWAVQEALGAKGFHAASRAMVVTNSFYTKQAHELAVANAVDLMDRHHLAALIAKVSRKQRALSE